MRRIGYFFILKSEDGTLTSYESVVQKLDKEELQDSDLRLREIIQLVHGWVGFCYETTTLAQVGVNGHCKLDVSQVD